VAYELLVLEIVVAAILGSIGHELAHWLIWQLTGRQPRLELLGNAVYPQAGPAQVTLGDRLAAAAPYAGGAGAVLSGIVLQEVLLVTFGAGMLLFVSREDVAVILGRGEWEFGS